VLALEIGREAAIEIREFDGVARFDQEIAVIDRFRHVS
jgi:hypothetical protein